MIFDQYHKPSTMKNEKEGWQSIWGDIFNTVSSHLMLLMSSETLCEMTYKKTNFITGHLM